jgi:hypothetical protein
MARKKKDAMSLSPLHMSTGQHSRLEGVKVTSTKFKKPSLKSQMRKVRVVKSTPY